MEKEINIEQELYKAFGQVKDFTLGMRIAKWFYEMGKNSQEPVSEDLEVELTSYMENSFTSVEEPDEFLTTVMQKDDLLAFARHFANWQKEQFENNRLKHCNSITNEQAELEQGFIDQHLDKYQRIPTFLDAIEYGMQLQKQQMMAKAVDIEVKVDAGGYPYIPQLELYDYDKDVPLAKEGDKYKVILIKKDEP